MLVCPSDHHIGDCEAFQNAARAAAALAADDWLVSFGIAATAPETGFGYLKQGDPIEGSDGRRVERFVEKPDLDRAKAFLADGGYAWNGGIFAFRAGHFLAELERHRPDIVDAVRASVDKGHAQGNAFHPDPAEFAKIAGESVDYAVMEKTDRAAMVPATMAWSDIGNWAAVWAHSSRDPAGNAVSGDVLLEATRDSLVRAGGMTVALAGVEPLPDELGEHVLIVVCGAAGSAARLLSSAPGKAAVAWLRQHAVAGRSLACKHRGARSLRELGPHRAKGAFRDRRIVRHRQIDGRTHRGDSALGAALRSRLRSKLAQEG